MFLIRAKLVQFSFAWISTAFNYLIDTYEANNRNVKSESMKRLEKSSCKYGALGRRASLPNIDSSSIEDPISHDYEISDQLDSVSSTNDSANQSKKVKYSSYVIEPVAFLQNLATSIMSVSSGQFIYERIYDRLVREHMNDGHHNHTNLTMYYSLGADDCLRNVSVEETLTKMFASVG